jgi:hypothetical protein
LRLAATPAALAAATSVMTGAQLSIVLVAVSKSSVKTNIIYNFVFINHNSSAKNILM